MTEKKITPLTWLIGLAALGSVGALSFWYMDQREGADVQFGQDLAWLALDRSDEIVDAAGDLPDFDFLEHFAALEAANVPPQ